MSQTDPSTGTGSDRETERQRDGEKERYRGEKSSTRGQQRTRGRKEGGKTTTGRAPATGQAPFRARAHDRDNDRREPHTRLAHVQGPSRERKPRFFFFTLLYTVSRKLVHNKHRLSNDYVRGVELFVNIKSTNEIQITIAIVLCSISLESFSYPFGGRGIASVEV